MNLILSTETRREYIPVGSTPASLLVMVTAANIAFLVSNFAGQQ